MRNQRGQTTVEYLLIIAVIVVVISVFGKSMQKHLPKTVDKVFEQVNAAIERMTRI